MAVLVYLVPMALTLGLLGLGGFLWSLRSGQYDDLDGAAWRAILDDDDLTSGAAPGELASPRPSEVRPPPSTSGEVKGPTSSDHASASY
jgi:cbb3-type cytochrome oxidase maturation protein